MLMAHAVHLDGEILETRDYRGGILAGLQSYFPMSNKAPCIAGSTSTYLLSQRVFPKPKDGESNVVRRVMRTTDLRPTTCLRFLCALPQNDLIVDSDLATIRGCKNLAMLDLYLTSITDKAMEHLVDLPLEVLVISQTELGDVALASVGKIKTLRRLELFDTNVTDVGLKHLHNLKSLRVLFLGDSKYSPEGLRELRKALPGCEIAAN